MIRLVEFLNISALRKAWCLISCCGCTTAGGKGGGSSEDW